MGDRSTTHKMRIRLRVRGARKLDHYQLTPYFFSKITHSHPLASQFPTPFSERRTNPREQRQTCCGVIDSCQPVSRPPLPWVGKYPSRSSAPSLHTSDISKPASEKKKKEIGISCVSCMWRGKTSEAPVSFSGFLQIIWPRLCVTNDLPQRC